MVSDVADSSLRNFSHQQQRKMRLYVLTVLVAVLAMAGRCNAFCPVGCFCDDETLQVTCDEANLEVIPITLNPSVQVIFHFKTRLGLIRRFYVHFFQIEIK